MAQTVSAGSLLAMGISAFVAVVLPVVLLLLARGRLRAPVFPAVLGVLVFPVFVLLLESMVAKSLMSHAAFHAFIYSRGIICALYGGLMAGLFEETGRMIAFIVLGRWYNKVGCAVSYGIGHGGVEAVWLLGIPMLRNMQMAGLVNRAGGLDSLLTITPELAGAAERLEILIAGHYSLYLAGGVERLSAIAFHIAASVLLWMAVSRRGPFWLYPMAIACHALLNIPAGLYQYGTLKNIWTLELVTLLVSAVFCGFTVYIYRYYKERSHGMKQYVPFRL